jgi:hypothetical protein
MLHEPKLLGALVPNSWAPANEREISCNSIINFVVRSSQKEDGDSIPIPPCGRFELFDDINKPSYDTPCYAFNSRENGDNIFSRIDYRDDGGREAEWSKLNAISFNSSEIV